MAQLKDLIVNGPSRFIGDVYATTFTGDLNGNANTATSATTAAALTGKTLVTASAVTTSNWPTYKDNHIPTMSFMAHWNGAYSGTSSNLTYCVQGAIIGSKNIGSQSVNYATTSGSCSGNAATATKATQDGNGNIITSTYLPLSGGTINGNLKIGAIDNTSYKYLVLFRSGHFARINNTEKDAWFAFGTVSDTGVLTAEKVLKIGDNGIQYSPDSSSYYDILHAGNLTSYAPSLTGSGATGTWGISISGNATNADKLDGYHASSFSLTSHTHSYIVTQGDTRSVATVPSDYKNKITFAGLKYNSIIGNPSSTSPYSYVIGLRGWSDTSGGKAHELAFNDNGIFHRIGATDTWESWAMMLTTSNYNSYVPSLTGSGASGTWGINISGNAASATNAGYATTAGSAPASDVYTWAKASTKPTYNATEVKLTGYSKNSSYSAISASDTVQAAVGKLEGAISGLEELLASI